MIFSTRYRPEITSPEGKSPPCCGLNSGSGCTAAAAGEGAPAAGRGVASGAGAGAAGAGAAGAGAAGAGAAAAGRGAGGALGPERIDGGNGTVVGGPGRDCGDEGAGGAPLTRPAAGRGGGGGTKGFGGAGADTTNLPTMVRRKPQSSRSGTLSNFDAQSKMPDHADQAVYVSTGAKISGLSSIPLARRISAA